MQHPTAPRLSLTDDHHGTSVPDPYRWLEDPDDGTPAEWVRWRERWEHDQEGLFARERERWTTEQRFVERITELVGGGYHGLPVWRADLQFFMRRLPGQQFGVLHVTGPDGAERVLIDPMELDPSGRTTLDGWSPSWDGRRLAHLLSEAGTEESVLRVMDVASGEIIDGPIERTRFSSIGWLPGGEQFYYVRRLAPDLVPAGEEQFHRRVYLHTVGTDPDQDTEVFGDGRPATDYFSASTTRDGRWLTVSASEGTAPRNDLYLARIDDPADPDLRTVIEGRDCQTDLTIRPDGRMLVYSDEGAPRGRLLIGDPTDPAPQHWRELIGEDEDFVVESFRFVDGPQGPDQYLCVQRTRHTIGELHLYDSHTGEHIRRLVLPGLGTVMGPTARPEGGAELWFGYTDSVTPPLVYRYDTITAESRVWARPPGSVRVPDVRAEQVHFASADGTTVRMLVLGRPGHGPRPTILYGYGGFGISLAPAFSATALAWVEAGGMYAIANLRGGGEEGEQWHRDGMLANKQNVFDDFHAAAEHLLEQGWTTPEQLCISGGSNGGLLVGAAITQRPELYGSAVCAAPLLDMIRYTTSQLGATWTVEYGDPRVPAEFDWLYAYSPYHRVRQDTAYPAVLMTVFENDTRTDPMHGRKFVAQLQHAGAGPAPIILRQHTQVGHGARALDTAVAESAESLAFAAHHTGLAGRRPDSPARD